MAAEDLQKQLLKDYLHDAGRIKESVLNILGIGPRIAVRKFDFDTV